MQICSKFVMAAKLQLAKGTGYVKSDQMKSHHWHNNYGLRMPLILKATTIKFYPWLSGSEKAPAAVG